MHSAILSFEQNLTCVWSDGPESRVDFLVGIQSIFALQNLALSMREISQVCLEISFLAWSNYGY